MKTAASFYTVVSFRRRVNIGSKWNIPPNANSQAEVKKIILIWLEKIKSPTHPFMLLFLSSLYSAAAVCICKTTVTLLKGIPQSYLGSFRDVTYLELEGSSAFAQIYFGFPHSVPSHTASWFIWRPDLENRLKYTSPCNFRVKQCSSRVDKLPLITSCFSLLSDKLLRALT